MTTTSSTASTRSADLRTRPMISRVVSLAKGELRMLLRNKTAIFNVMLMPLLLLGFLAFSGAMKNSGNALGNSILISSMVLATAYVIYYNLVTTFCARRESYVLKRMRTGPTSDLGVLAATSVPSIVLALMQIMVVLIALIAIGRAPTVGNIVPVLLAVALGITAFTGLAMLSTGFTKTAETAQITTLPVVMVTMGLSGMFFPLHKLPEVIMHIGYMTPGGAMVELLNLGLSAMNRFGEHIEVAHTWSAMLRPSAVLAVWTAMGVLYVRRQFHWEPRR